MKTLYDVGDTVLIRAKVHRIQVSETGTEYMLIIPINDQRYLDSKVDVFLQEDNVVCGWIGGGRDDYILHSR